MEPQLGKVSVEKSHKKLSVHDLNEEKISLTRQKNVPLLAWPALVCKSFRNLPELEL